MRPVLRFSSRLFLSTVSLFCLNASYTLADVPPWERPPDALAPYVLPPWGLTVEDFVVTRQVPLSTGQREVLLTSPSTGSAQRLTVSLPDAPDYQLYEIGFERVLAAGEGTTFEAEETRQLLNNFQVKFENNTLSDVVLADGSSAEFSAGRAVIKSPAGEVTETVEAAWMGGHEIAAGDKSSGSSTDSSADRKERMLENQHRSKAVAQSVRQIAQLDSAAMLACERDVYTRTEQIARSIEAYAGPLAQRQSDLAKAMGWALGHSSEALKNSLELADPIQALTCRPPVQCEEARLSGGSEIRTDLFDIPKGANGSSVVLTYEFFQIPDSLEMFYDGNKIFSVGPASGSSQESFQLPASAQQLGITLRGNNDPETRWWYVISCDADSVINQPTVPLDEN